MKLENKEVRKSDAVLYFTLRDMMLEYKDSILDAFDYVYKITPEERAEGEKEFYSLSEMLYMASDIAEEIEANSDYGDNVI